MLVKTRTSVRIGIRTGKDERRRRRLYETSDLLAVQLQQILGADCRIRLKREKPWASITFSGTRHYFEVRTDPAIKKHDLDNSLRQLNSHEFEIPGHFVADILIHEYRPSDAYVAIDVLTIIDPVINQRRLKD